MVNNHSMLSYSKGKTNQRSQNNKSFATQGSSRKPAPTYPKLDFKTDADFPIRILDNMIQVEEEQHNGFSLYNRGQNLKKCLINPDRVREFLMKREHVETIPDKSIAQYSESDQDTIFNQQYTSSVIRPPHLPDPIGSMADCKFNFLTDKNIDDDK